MMDNRVLVKVFCFLLVVSIALTSCSSFPQNTSTPDQGNEPPIKNSDYVLIRTTDPNFRVVSTNKAGEILAAMIEPGPNGTIAAVKGAIYKSPKGQEVSVSLGEDGLPAQAITNGDILQFTNFTDSTVDIKITTHDGKVTSEKSVPINTDLLNRLKAYHHANSGGIAFVSYVSSANQMSAKDAMVMAGIIIGVFSCAATIASGGVLGLAFGFGCAQLLIGILIDLDPNANPTVVDANEGGGAILDGYECGKGVITNDIIDTVSGCSGAIVDIANSILDADKATVQKLSENQLKNAQTGSSNGKDGMILLYIPAGNFLMGSTDTDQNGNPKEKPQHTVYLDEFWIDQTDVTNAQYAKCVSAGACQAPSPTYSTTHSSYYDNPSFAVYPVIYVTWYMAAAYCQWVGRELPTEAQWEKAARGVDGRIYPWGNQAPDNALANYNKNVGDTTAVGSYPAGASPYGALDMAGNVWQWVADWYSDTYYQQSPANNPTGPSTGDCRVIRGGGWDRSSIYERATDRVCAHQGELSGTAGFRCAFSQP